MPSRPLPDLLLVAALNLATAAVLLAGCEPEAADDDAIPDDDASPDDDTTADDDTTWAPDLVCPGDDSGICDAGGDGVLEAGAAAVPITPELWEAWTDLNGDAEYAPTSGDTFFDCGTDRLCPETCAYLDGSTATFGESPGYPGPDANGTECDQAFQAVWLAGFQNSRAMNGVHDELWARAMVLRQGETTLGLVALDVVGYFYNEVLEVRERARAELDLDHVVVASTHVHEGPDTMGMWGRSQFESGLDPAYMTLVQDRAIQALAEAKADLRAARATYGHHVIQDDEAFGKGINNYNIDHRDPGIHDPNVWAVRFSATEGDATIATLVNWANHPETLADENTLITSDYVDGLRRAVEEGVDTPEGRIPGLGGIAVFFSGPLGGMMTPLGVTTSDLFGLDTENYSFAKSDAIGQGIGLTVLESLAAAEAIVDEAPALSFRTTSFKVLVENVLFAILFQAGIFDRPIYDYDEDEPVSEDNPPTIMTEIDLLQIGPASILTIPGELLPEWAVGGYDGSLTGPLRVFIEDTEHAPPVEDAPGPPYLYDQMPGDYTLIFALGNDEIGYLIPPYNYVLHEDNPYISEAPGHHYEETNSVGPNAAPQIVDTALRLMAWGP